MSLRRSGACVLNKRDIRLSVEPSSVLRTAKVERAAASARHPARAFARRRDRRAAHPAFGPAGALRASLLVGALVPALALRRRVVAPRVGADDAARSGRRAARGGPGRAHGPIRAL